MKKLFCIFILGVCCLTNVKGNSGNELQLVEQKLPSCFSGLIKNGSVKCIHQDRRGFTWVSSLHGVALYDGYEFKYFRHDKNNPQSIANSVAMLIREDSKGNIWFGLLSGGLSCYNPLTNTFKNYSTKAIVSSKDIIHSLYIDSKDEIWFSIGYKGLIHLNKETGTFKTWDVVTAARCPNTKPHKVPLHNFLPDITGRDADNLWLGTPEGLFSFNKKTNEITVMREKQSKELHHDIYNANSIVKDGRYIWTGGWGSGIQCYDTLTKTWSDYNSKIPGEAYILNNLIYRILRKDDDEFWIASADRGLGTFNTTTRTFYFFASDPAFSYLPKTGAYYLNTDRQNNLYVVYNDNLFFFKQKPNLFKKYMIPSYQKINAGLSQANCLFEDKSKRYVYVATSFSDGIIRYDRLTNSSKAISLKMNNKKIATPDAYQFLERDSASVWMLTNDIIYIYYYTEDKIVLPPQPPLLNKLRGTNSYTTMDKQGEKILWIGTNYNGAIKYDVETGKSECFATDEKDTAHFISNYVHTTLIDAKGNLWYGNARSAVVAHYNTLTGKSICFDKEGKKCDLQNSVETYTLYSDGNDVYVCTPAGLMIFDVSENEPRLKRKIDEHNNFTSNYIFYVYKENDSILWMSTAYGEVRYNLNSKNYEIVESNNNVENMSIVFLVSNAGTLFIVATRCIYEYLPFIKSAKDKPIAPVLTSFKVNDVAVNFTSEINTNAKIIIEPGYSYFTVSYASLDYSNTPDIRYSYKLEGIHKIWIDAGEMRNATFSNLNGGNYILKIRSTIDNGANFSSVTSIPVYIETIFYKTIWFRGLVAGVVGFLLFGIYRYRTNQQQEIMELNNRAQLLEKEKSVVQYENLRQQLNPHFLFNSLTSLSSLISSEPKIARQFVDQMSKIYRYILKSSENETVPLINEINFASTYVKLQQTRFSEGFEVKINVNEEFNHRKIVPVTIQNLIENAIKHNIIDTESPLVIDIYVEDEYLVVKNNLQKKNIVETSNQHGLNQMKTLYKYLSDKPIVINETIKEFTIKIPLI